MFTSLQVKIDTVHIDQLVICLLSPENMPVIRCYKAFSTSIHVIYEMAAV